MSASNCKHCKARKEAKVVPVTCDACRASKKNWNKNNPKYAASYSKKWKQDHPEQSKERWRKRRLSALGLTLEEFDSLLESQCGVCAICHEPETDKGNNGETKRLAVDHCHRTGIVRGLLCGSCNRMLGQVDDRVEVLRTAIEYLSKRR